jgi:hypothetical protein
MKKIVENGIVYGVSETGTATIKQKIDPTLSCNAPNSVVSGATITISFELRDFDGEVRHDNRTISLVIEGDVHDFQMVNGKMDIDLTLSSVGTFRLRAIDSEFHFQAIAIEVTPE